ncbi:C1 family peptidase [Mycoplasma mycoides subsp. capri]|uniref:C1 family peptidase n=1 Tax=Mycoplasma mycoides TaxID=2102 RepID=UPI00223F8F75|nr:C1 family peptidase [Mycoplasma mycoides]UZK63802.1 C1 family peptidase [Mycoplasma mycoides subsp. capri]
MKKTNKKIILLLQSIIIFVLIFLIFLKTNQNINITYVNKMITNTSDNTNLSKENRSYYSLRDDYILFNQYQYNTGLCWDFSATKSLETSLMINNNEMYDLSEASISINQKDLIGGGAWFFDYDQLIKENGISFESDFMLGDLYYVPNKGEYKTWLQNIYNSKNIKSFRDQVKDVSFNRYDLLNIKKHIVNNGSLFVPIKNYATKENQNYKHISIKTNNKTKVHELIYTSKINTHAVSIIGWDDQYLASDNSKGAFIVLNSDGYYSNNDGINFLPYNSKAIINDLNGYEYIADKLLISKSNNNFNNEFSNYYNTKNYGQKNYSSKAKNTNIFNTTQDVKIEYHINNNLAKLYNINAYIYLNDLDVSDLFKINSDQNKITIQSKDKLKSGSYTVKLIYQYSLLKDKTNKIKVKHEHRQIYLLDQTNTISSNSYWDYNNQQHLVFHNYNSFVANDNLPVILIDKNNNLNFEYKPLYLYSDKKDKISYKINQKDILKPETISNKDQNEFQLDIDKYVDNKKIASNKYQFYRLDNNINYYFAKIYLTNNTKIKNLANEITFFKNSYFDKKYLETPTNNNLKFLKYVYINKNGQEQDLLFDQSKNKYYISYEIIDSLKTNVLDLNYIGNKHKTNNQTYNTPIIIKPVFEKKEPILIINNTKKDYLTNQKINDEFDIKIIDNNQIKHIKPNVKIKNINNEYIDTIKYNDNKIILEFEYNNRTYNLDFNINPIKIIINIKPKLENTFIYDKNYHKLEFDTPINKNIIKITNNEYINSGNYITTLEIIDNNYVFNNNKNKLEFKWSIKPKQISESSIINKDKLIFDNKVLYSYDNKVFKEYHSLDKLEIPFNKIIYFKYKNDLNHDSSSTIQINLEKYNLQNNKSKNITIIVLSIILPISLITIITITIIIIKKKNKKHIK